jgi:hypothetical protein
MPVGDGIEALYSPVFGSTTQLDRNWDESQWRQISKVGGVNNEVYKVEVETYTVTSNIYGSKWHLRLERGPGASAKARVVPGVMLEMWFWVARESCERWNLRLRNTSLVLARITARNKVGIHLLPVTVWQEVQFMRCVICANAILILTS